MEKSFPWVWRVLQPCLQCCRGAADPSARLSVEPPLIPSLPVETFALCFFRSRWRDSKPPGAHFPLGLGSSLRKGRAGSGSPRAAVAPPAAPVTPAGASPPRETEWVCAVLPIWGYSAVRVRGPPEPSRKGEQGGVGQVGSGGERPWLTKACHPPQRVRKPLGAGTRSALLRGVVVALVKINEGGKRAAAGMREILRVALSTHSQISQANPSLSMQIPAASPRTAGETGATLLAIKPLQRGSPAHGCLVQRCEQPCTLPSPPFPSPQAGQALPAAPLSAASSVAPLAGALCLSPLVALLPFRACRALQARPG